MNPKPKSNPKYPWKDWLKPGKKVVLRQGKEFATTVQVHGMAQQVRDRASQAGKSVQLKIDGATILVYTLTTREQRALIARRALLKRA